MQIALGAASKRSVLLLAPFWVLLTGCAVAGGETASVSVEPIAIMTAWTVPARDIRASSEVTLQVRIAPLTRLPDATLELDVPEGAFMVGGTRRILLGTVGPPAAPQVSKPPSPPALGMTVVNSFSLTPVRQGSFEIKIVLKSGDRSQTFMHSMNVDSK